MNAANREREVANRCFKLANRARNSANRTGKVQIADWILQKDELHTEQKMARSIDLQIEPWIQQIEQRKLQIAG
ncbi:hypothetical protein HUN92_06625 [Bacillus firmus]|uniref:hypothetical protein n=1 Tax=Cytobacillus firmus TaxID=1399 RepID=UPI0015812E34|nr:hypothetical protein [Cytobacillus firmus]MBG9549216.1 hypothetical protein [Cytobacillus firmus]MBG9602063.1 hypothetical protein [Cytobacillus firmus]MBG9654514.1 hypothetical protein [Cytobacillus firmus]MED1905667.1 hypothetical protein [Cytobacillus firmus]MED1940463.1 hypothetical protein [Cytobacillus firmus]